MIRRLRHLVAAYNHWAFKREAAWLNRVLAGPDDDFDELLDEFPNATRAD